MKEIDLWAGEPLLPTMEEPKREEIDLNSIMGNSDDFDLDFDDVLDDSSPDFGSNDYILEIKDRDIYLHSKTQITSRDILGIRGTKEVELKDSYRYEIYNNQFSSYALKHYLAGEKLSISKEDLKSIEEAAEKVPTPRVSITEDRKHAHINIFNHEIYVNLLSKVNGYPLRNTPAYRFNISRLLDFEAMSANLETKMPPIFFEKEALEVNREPIVGFDGTIESLKDISIGALNVVAANTQSNRNAQKSSKTLEEKMAAFGISTLHDLMFWLPKRYIDKSKPQDISDLIEGESSTIIGKVKSANDMPKNMGVAFIIETASGQKIESIFWRQTWLKNKFKEGSEVMLTGKLSFYRRPGQKPKPQFGGSSIEFSEEASILPIVPIYRQSEAKGITTAFLMAASRELLSRIKGLKLPVYLRQEDRVDYHTALTELHFPSSIENHKEAVASLAYYELVHMQLIMQEAKEKSTERTGIEQEATPRKLQARAIKTLPFELTKSQKRAVVQMNKNLSGSTPSSTLLSADVGSGKGLLENESILTPKGWAKLKDLKVGDKVIGRNGKPTKIIGYFPQGEQEVARITFSDKSEIITDLAHRWTVMPTNQFANKYSTGKLPEYVLSTAQLLSDEPTVMEVKQGGRFGPMVKKVPVKTNFLNSRGNYKWKIPLLSAPVEYEKLDQKLPIDPYILGYWLGDGSSRVFELAVGKEDIENTRSLIQERWDGYTIDALDKRNGHVSLKLKMKGVYGTDILKKAGVYMNKHIPEIYLRATKEDRLALLQGLMDSDGSADKSGFASFGNNNKNLIDGVIELVRSLGGRAYISRERYGKYINKEGIKVTSPNLSYDVVVDMPLGLNPFMLARKAERYLHRTIERPKKSRSLTRVITNVERLDTKMKTICIKVEAQDELFVTKDYIVTHNTLVAQLSALKAVDAGYQAIVLGPTDILARQLYATLEKLVENIKKTGVEVNICYLSGGMKVREKKPLLKSIAEGEIDIIVGTHSVISDSMKYKNLGFVAIDEQQKFGASQRTNILNSREDGRIPDLLMMSATPIPRTTAQAYYGDMDIIELKEKPPGRLPIITEWIEEDPVEFTEQLVNKVWSDVRAEAAAGNQTFVITPMVNESDKIDAASVERTFKNLTETSLPDLRIGFAHGQMKPDEQRQAMQDFRDKKFDVLVASTVVEVGVDIPDATVVVVLSAERLGASSSHQIRGRVGRNSKQSKCYLVSLGKTDNSRTRLQALVDNTDGFEIAKVDLKVRGEGQMFGTEQSGRSEMIFASLLEHGNRIAEARDEAKRILRSGFRDKALEDSRRKFEADERLF